MRHHVTRHLLTTTLTSLIFGIGGGVSWAQDAEPSVEPAPETDPAARKIIDRAIEAIGGRSRREGISSTRSQARLGMGDAEALIDLTTMEGDRVRIRYTTEYQGRLDLMEIGCDGAQGWRIDPPDGRVTVITPKTANEFARSFDFQALIREMDLRFREPRLLPPDTFEDRPCQVLAMRNDDQDVRIFFEESTGLPLALELIEPNVRRSKRKVVIEAWSEPDEASPLRWVRRFRLEQAGGVWTANYSFVTFNDASESTFLPPTDLSVLPGGAVE